MRFLGKMADLMWLNILTMLCSIPIVTIGASFTALHYVCLKIVRDEDGYLTKAYFKSFKENFKQSTIMWLIMLVIGIFLGTDYYLIITGKVQLPSVFKMIMLAVTLLIAFTAVMIFPMQAKFANPIKNTIKNACMLAILQFPKTFLMLVLLVAPLYVTYVAIQIFPFVFLLGFSLPAYLSARLYNKSFLRIEQQILGQVESKEAEEGEEDNDERIFQDESRLDDESSENPAEGTLLP